jgi:ubiquinone/menaquinone biosynthesis C-methylase UbiE
MSTYVYMRLLESAPHRYDLGIRLLSLGRAAQLYRDVADAAAGGLEAPRVLEIGCGTGNLTEALVARGASVTAVDWNAEMLSVAEKKLAAAAGRVRLEEMAAVEIADRFPPNSFDAVASTLTFSEMSDDEQLYVLEAAHKVLREGGRLVIGDEVRPPNLGQRLRHACVRWPMAVLTYLLTQTSTAAVADLTGVIRRAGFRVVREQRTAHGSMAVVVAEKPKITATEPQRGA